MEDFRWDKSLSITIGLSFFDFTMRGCILYIVFFLLIPTLSRSQGLKFRGAHEPIDKRTSYELFDKKEISFEEEFTLKFQLSIYSSNSLGNIFRVKNKDNNTIYNLFYDEEGGNCIFRLNEEGKSSLIIAKINQQQLFKEEWIDIQLTFDLRQQLFKLNIQNETFQSPKVNLPQHYQPQVIFGKSDYLIDVPTMSIRNVRIGNTEKSYLFPLRENMGNIVHDENGYAYGYASNPTWLIVDSYRWKDLFASSSLSQAGSGYNQRTKEIYYFNQDSITIYNVKNSQTKKLGFQRPCPVKLVLANNFIDTTTNRLYVYELFYTQPYQGPTVASLDLQNFEWRVESSDLMKKELNHHGSFYDGQHRQFYIFGGYGNMAYSGQFNQYSLDSGKWQTVDGWTGDKIFPRYFLSAGQSANNRTAYIFGGMGNESGEHIVGRKYLYDFYQINLDTKKITKKWDLLWKDKHIVPARGLVFPDSSHFYSLCYSEYLTKSNIQLYRFSMKDGSFDILGDSIPIYSDKISTHAQLYYDQQLGRLLVLVQESKDDIQSTLKVYSLNMTPITLTELNSFPSSGSNYRVFLLLLLGTVAGIAVYFFWRRNGNKKKFSGLNKQIDYTNSSISDTTSIQIPQKEELSRPNAIFLFGEFRAFDRNKRDISYLFSTKLKQAFCLILSNRSGISSPYFSQMMWPDKSEDKVKNSRGVTINHLRKVLSEFKGIELIHKQGRFIIERTDEFYCDYVDCIELMANPVDASADRLIQIIQRGKFLQGLDLPLFDPLKTEVEQNLLPFLSTELQKAALGHFHKKSIEIAHTIFLLDPLNEEALFSEVKAMVALNQPNEARIKFQHFCLNYRQLMNEDFPYSLDSII